MGICEKKLKKLKIKFFKDLLISKVEQRQISYGPFTKLLLPCFIIYFVHVCIPVCLSLWVINFTAMSYVIVLLAKFYPILM